MDDFLHQLREQPRPEFAEALHARLAEADRRARRRATQTRAFGAAATFVATLALIISLNMRAPLRQPIRAGDETQQAASTLLLPVSESQANLPADPISWVALDATLHAPPTPISHHHQ